MSENKSKEPAGGVETVETVASESPESVVSTQSTESTVQEKQRSVNLAVAGSEAPTWPPPAWVGETGIVDAALRLARQFVPRRVLENILLAEAQAHANQSGLANIRSVRGLIDGVLVHLRESDLDHDWGRRLQVIFDGVYPSREREVWSSGRLCQRKYPKRPPELEYPVTFMVTTFEPIKEPKHSLCSTVAPMLFEIDDSYNKIGVKPTPEVERFLNGERLAVPKSALCEVVALNRPTWSTKSEWQPLEKGWLPRRVEAAETVAQTSDVRVVDEFIEDLKSTFAWAEPQLVASYLGYLIQPMIAHLAVGQMPAYGFFGPTKSGKGYLSSALPSIIYSRVGEPTARS